MRQIIFDTETTGMNFNRSINNPALGHRIIEIGCIELINRIPAKTFHKYINPEMPVDPGAYKVHGISDDYLKDKPTFKEIYKELMDFLDGADELIAHNISFDQAFLNQELILLKADFKLEDKFGLVDSLKIAKKKYPSQPNNLDALCKRFSINNSNRKLHGALLDAQLLSEVYLKMTGEQGNIFTNQSVNNSQSFSKANENKAKSNTDWLKVAVSKEEELIHQKIIDELAK